MKWPPPHGKRKLHDVEERIADDEVIVRYLLGELPAEEETGLERRYLADPALLDRIDAVEDDLIDDYVRDALPPEQREHFESRFLTAERLERVRLAEALRREALLHED
jgi:anti-sigma factor RsiW